MEPFGGIDLLPEVAAGANSEDLYSTFAARAAMMGWSTSSHRSAPPLWGMNDATLLSGDARSRVARLQVGLDGTGIGVVLLPLIRCVGDALVRMGTVHLNGIGVTCLDAAPSAPDEAHLISALNWFNAVGTRAGGIDAAVVISADVARHDTVLDQLQRLNTAPFEFYPPAERPARVPADLSPGRNGPFAFDVRLPEWTFDAIGWVLALAADTITTSLNYSGTIQIEVARR